MFHVKHYSKNRFGKGKEMKSLFALYNIEISEQQIELFYKYYELLIQWNKKMNLTAITDYNEVLKKHFLDSCLILQVYSKDLFFEKKIIDVGTGAGFPGIPLSILLPDTKFTLLDSLSKRIDFLCKVIEDLQLYNVKVFHGRAEDFGRDKSFREQYDFCVSRAVASLSLLLEYCSPFIKTDGKLLLYKSRNTCSEIESAANAFSVLNCRLVDDKKIADEEEFQRYILEIEKNKSTPEKFPRKAGKPKKYPL